MDEQQEVNASDKLIGENWAHLFRIAVTLVVLFSISMRKLLRVWKSDTDAIARRSWHFLPILSTLVECQWLNAEARKVRHSLRK